ncbi:MAG TPA: DUF6526 family protein [Vicinamibacterales bacterium]|nr:DUF6526 family protein [Vicinamibacterales bacterium]
MAEQSFASHTHRPILTAIVWALALTALVLMVQSMRGANTRDWAIIAVTLAVIVLGVISRAYTVRLQDRIIMLEEKVRAAELLDAGRDTQLAKLSAKQIAALRFASDAEFPSLLERAARENLAPKEIKAAIKTWRPDLRRT